MFATDLQRLVDAVKAKGVDIAPTYSEYLQLAFAIATDCGEAGRSGFHELCSLSSKYRRQDADRLFTRALRDGRGEVHLGTAFHLAERAGVKVEMPVEKATAQGRNLQDLQCNFFHPSLPHGRAYNKVENDSDEVHTGSEPLLRLPVFPDYDWPRLLTLACNYGATPAQRDVLLISSLVALGACMGSQVHCAYGGKEHLPCLQLFVVAPPASGKGVLSFVRKFLEPHHYEIRREVEKQFEAYRREKAAYEVLGKKRGETEAPRPPKNRMFIIPGNNTGIMAFRIACVTAVQRMLETEGRLEDYALLRPDDGIPQDNLKDGIITRWLLGITDADLDAVLALMDTLYRHAMHVLSFLPGTEVNRRVNAERNVFFAMLPDFFTRRDVLKLAESMGLKKSTANSWLYRLMAKGVIEPDNLQKGFRKKVYGD